MARHFYSSISFVTTLSAGITNAQGTITCPESASDNGWPTSFPFTLALDYGTAGQELVDVTSKGGLAGGIRTWNVTRGVDGSPAVPHNAGAVVRHPIVGRDLEEAGSHEYASSGVHGLTGAVVGTTDTQTLLGKTLSTLDVGSAAASGANGVVLTRSNLAVSIGNAGWTDATFDTLDPTARYQDDGTLVGALPTGTFSTRALGFYLLNMIWTFAATSTAGIRQARWVTQGGTVLGQTPPQQGADHDGHILTCQTIFFSGGGGYAVRPQVYQSSGGALNSGVHGSATPMVAQVVKLHI